MRPPTTEQSRMAGPEPKSSTTFTLAFRPPSSRRRSQKGFGDNLVEDATSIQGARDGPVGVQQRSTGSLPPGLWGAVVACPAAPHCWSSSDAANVDILIIGETCRQTESIYIHIHCRKNFAHQRLSLRALLDDSRIHASCCDRSISVEYAIGGACRSSRYDYSTAPFASNATCAYGSSKARCIPQHASGRTGAGSQFLVGTPFLPEYCAKCASCRKVALRS